MSRLNRRRQGHTEFRDNDNLDRRDINGNVLAERPERPKQADDSSPKKKRSLKELLKEWDRESEEERSSPKPASPMSDCERGKADSDSDSDSDSDDVRYCILDTSILSYFSITIIVLHTMV